MRANVRRSVLVVLLACLATLLGPVETTAQPGIAFLESTAEADFPNEITFSMAAEPASSVESVELYWRPVGSVAWTMAQPEMRRGDTVEVSLTVDMSIRHLPPGLDIEYYWRIMAEDGQIHESSRDTLFYMDQRFEWSTLQAGLVSVWWYEGSNEFAEEIAHAANRTLLTLESDFGITSDTAVRIIVYGRDRDFASAIRPNSAEWIGGVAYSSLGHIVAHIRPGSNATREIDRMIPHEVAHVAVHHASRNPYNTPPPWLDEGLATFVQRSGDPRLQSTLSRAVRDGSLMPIGALKSSFPLDPDQALLSYAASLSIVTYLVETYGAETVGELVTVYATEVSHEEAVEAVLGMSIADLDSAWKQSLGYAGDRQGTAGESVATLGIPREAWYAAALLLIGATTAGFVLLLFWRTRTYASNEAEDADGDAFSDAV